MEAALCGRGSCRWVDGGDWRQMWRPNTERSCRSSRLSMSPSCPRQLSIVPPAGPAITACGTAAAVLHDVGHEIFIDSRQTQRLAPIGWDATPSLQSIRNPGCLDGRILRRNLLAAASSCRISPPNRPGRAGSPRQVTGTPTPARRPLSFPPRLGRPSSLSSPIPQLPGELGGEGARDRVVLVNRGEPVLLGDRRPPAARSLVCAGRTSLRCRMTGESRRSRRLLTC